MVVTGGASGIGLVIARRFTAAGYRVHVFDVDAAALSAALAANPEFRGTAGDVAVPADTQRGMDEALGWLGAVDVLVNDAAIPGPRAPLEDMPDDEWDRTIRVNLYGMFNWMKRVVPGMKERGHGAIVNISTGSVLTLPANRSVYNVSKWGVEGLTRSAARELGPHGIRVNAIRPGMVNNPRMRAIVERIAQQENRSPDEVEADFLKYISLRTKVEPEDIANTAVFLASDEARHITGQLIGVDGDVQWEQ